MPLLHVAVHQVFVASALIATHDKGAAADGDGLGTVPHVQRLAGQSPLWHVAVHHISVAFGSIA